MNFLLLLTLLGLGLGQEKSSSLGPFLLRSQGRDDVSSKLESADEDKAPEEQSRISDLELQPRQGDVEIDSPTQSSGIVSIY